MENHKEDILKKFLQDTFSDYEPEPSEASWENIFSAIQPNQPTFWDKSKPWIASVLVILTGAWLWYSSTAVEVNQSEIALGSGRVGTLATDEGVVAMHERKTRPQIKQILPIFTNKNNENQIESIKSVPSVGYSSGRMETIATDVKYSKEIIVNSHTPKEEGENHPIVEKQSDETVVSKDNLIATTSERVEKFPTHERPQILPTLLIYTDKNISKNQRKSVKSQNPLQVQSVVYASEWLETHATDAKTINPGMMGIENSIVEQVRYIRPIESLQNKDFTLTKIALSSPLIMPIISPNREAKPVRRHTYLSMSITPIQTYRILTINNQSVQKVQTNNLFDSERNGWQFDLGMIKPIGKLWNFRANLSYLRMRQWSEYQIGTNELVLRNNNSSSNSNLSQGTSSALEVVGQTVTESKNLHMVGLKMDVQKFFKITPKNRYFFSTGTQVMYENTQKQSNIFLNVSAGFQHIVSKTTFLTIEPIGSYSLNNFNDSKSLLQANGYNLGLKMGVSFKVK